MLAAVGDITKKGQCRQPIISVQLNHLKQFFYLLFLRLCKDSQTGRYINKECLTALLQHGADPSIRNTEGKTAVEVAEGGPRAVLTGEHRKEELLEAARAGAEERLVALLTPLNVNCHASDGRRSTPLHLAAGYNRHRVVTLLLQHGADVHAKDKG